eukprot:8099794-Pyramimonas_sp.AAC.2
MDNTSYCQTRALFFQRLYLQDISEHLLTNSSSSMKRSDAEVRSATSTISGFLKIVDCTASSLWRLSSGCSRAAVGATPRLGPGASD